MKSCVGIIPITERQAERLALPERTRISPLLEKCCLRISANESYQNVECWRRNLFHRQTLAEAEIEALAGIKVGHSTLHRLVDASEFSPPDKLISI